MRPIQFVVANGEECRQRSRFIRKTEPAATWERTEAAAGKWESAIPI
jgi:hypothetical protein